MVKGGHTYFVGLVSALVHNTGCGETLPEGAGPAEGEAPSAAVEAPALQAELPSTTPTAVDGAGKAVPVDAYGIPDPAQFTPRAGIGKYRRPFGTTQTQRTSVQGQVCRPPGCGRTSAVQQRGVPRAGSWPAVYRDGWRWGRRESNPDADCAAGDFKSLASASSATAPLRFYRSRRPRSRPAATRVAAAPLFRYLASPFRARCAPR